MSQSKPKQVNRTRSVAPPPAKGLRHRAVAPKPIFEDVDIDVEFDFEGIERKSDRPENAVSQRAFTETELAELHKLFAELVPNHLGQVRDFMMDLRWGHAGIAWIEICEPAVASLRIAAEKLEFLALSSALDDFSEALRAARVAGPRTIEGSWRQAVLVRHAALTALLPQAFAFDGDRNRREAIILQSLLAQIPDMQKLIIDKLYAAGMTSLETMLLTTTDDVAATTGIHRPMAERIVQRFHTYRNELATTAPDPARSRERERIRQLLAQVRLQQADFELVRDGWTSDASTRKRQLRRERTQTMLDINVLLARLGEIELLHELERFSTERRLERIDTFLEMAKEKYGAQAKA